MEPVVFDEALTHTFLELVMAERKRQFDKWGEQHHGNGTGTTVQQLEAQKARQVCDANFEIGVGTWQDILFEEYCEAMAEKDLKKLKEELVQVAAVAVAWLEDIDRKMRAAGDQQNLPFVKES